nr:ORF4a [Merbecovirus sp.]BDI08839.1 ORF4a [Merbecovirus sp.]
MDYVSLLNQVWQHYTNPSVNTGIWISPPVVDFTPVTGTTLHPVQWQCKLEFLDCTGQAVNSTKALAKQDAARQVAWQLHRQGKLSGFSLRWRYN